MILANIQFLWKLKMLNAYKFIIIYKYSKKRTYFFCGRIILCFGEEFHKLLSESPKITIYLKC